MGLPNVGLVGGISVDDRAEPVAYLEVYDTVFFGRRVAADGTWQSTPCSGPPGWEYVFPVGDPATVYCFYPPFGNAHRSLDGGLTWDALQQIPPEALEGLPTKLRISGSDIEISSDGGLSYENRAGPGEALASGTISRADGTIFVATEEGELFRSEDTGESWEALGTLLDGLRVIVIAAHPLEAGRLAASLDDGSFATSIDRGATWEAIVPEGLGVHVDDAARLGPDELLATKDGGLLRLVGDQQSDGGWEPAMAPAANSRRLLRSPLGARRLLLITDDGATFWTTDGGSTWTDVEVPLDCELTRIVAAPEERFVCFDRAFFWSSSDFGQSWQIVSREPPPQLEDGFVGQGFVISDLSSLFVIRGRSFYNDLVVSRDAGETWQRALEDGEVFTRQGIAGLVEDPTDRDAVYVFGVLRIAAPRIPANGGFVARFIDGGTRLESLVRVSGEPLNSLAVETRDGEVYVGTRAGRILSSRDRGSTWNEHSQPWGRDLWPHLSYDQIQHRLDVITGSGIYTTSLETATCSRPGRLCLGDDLALDATWRLEGEPEQAAVATPLTSNSGAFWFFEEDNLEVVVKVLDGCAINGHYWLFATGLTDVETRVTIRRLGAPGLATYDSPAGQPFQAIRDVEALPCE